MRSDRAKSFVRWIFSLIFAIEGIYLLIPSHNIEAYARWGYPPWLHVIAGASLLLTAILLPFRRIRWLGAGIGGCFIALETVATALHHDYAHAVQGPVFLVLLIWLVTPLKDVRQFAR